MTESGRRLVLVVPAPVGGEAPGGSNRDGASGNEPELAREQGRAACRAHGQLGTDLLDDSIALILDGTFASLLDVWLADACKRCGRSEVAALRSVCKRVRAVLGDRQLGAVDDTLLDAYLHGLAADGYSERTVENHRRVLRRVCAFGRQVGVLGAELGLGLYAPASRGGQRARCAAAPLRAATAGEQSRVPTTPGRLPKPKVPNAVPQPKDSPAQAQALVLGSPSVAPKPSTALDPTKSTWQEVRLGQRW